MRPSWFSEARISAPPGRRNEPASSRKRSGDDLPPAAAAAYSSTPTATTRSKPLVVGELLHGPADHLHVDQTGAAHGRGPRSRQASLQGHHLGTGLPEVAGDGAHSGTDLQHPLTGADGEGLQQAAAVTGQVVAGRPVADLGGQLVRAGGTIRSPLEDPQDALLGAVLVGQARPEYPNPGHRVLRRLDRSRLAHHRRHRLDELDPRRWRRLDRRRGRAYLLAPERPRPQPRFQAQRRQVAVGSERGARGPLAELAGGLGKAVEPAQRLPEPLTQLGQLLPSPQRLQDRFAEGGGVPRRAHEADPLPLESQAQLGDAGRDDRQGGPRPVEDPVLGAEADLVDVLLAVDADVGLEVVVRHQVASAATP